MSEADEGTVQDAGFDEWFDALERGEAYYLACPEGHGSLPPRRVCPDCGSTDLGERPLPAVGTVETFTVTHIPTPSFEEDAPYAAAIADFGPVRLTGQVVGIDVDAVDVGLTVEAEVRISETRGERLVGFRPR